MQANHADVTPEDLRQFASELRAFNERLDADGKSLMAKFTALGSSTWRDQVNSHFAQEFEQTIRVITHFKQSSDQHIPFLLKKAQKAEDYLGRG